MISKWKPINLSPIRKPILIRSNEGSVALAVRDSVRKHIIDVATVVGSTIQYFRIALDEKTSKFAQYQLANGQLVGQKWTEYCEIPE